MRTAWDYPPPPHGIMGPAHSVARRVYSTVLGTSGALLQTGGLVPCLAIVLRSVLSFRIILIWNKMVFWFKYCSLTAVNCPRPVMILDPVCLKTKVVTAWLPLEMNLTLVHLNYHMYFDE